MQLPGKAGFGMGDFSEVNLRRVSLLGGFCFFLSALEYLVPKPLPFLRLGLANFPLLLALDVLPFPSFVLLIGLKVIGQALISGTLFSYVFLFSVAGTAVSALLMYAARNVFRKERISLIGTSTAGALAFNGVQLLLARVFVFGESVRYAAAPILGLGLVTGTLLGALCEYFIKRSTWYKVKGKREKVKEKRESREQRAESNEQRKEEEAKLRNAREAFCEKTFNSNELAVAGLCMVPALLFNPDTPARVLQFLFFFLLAWLSGKRNNLLIMVSVMAGIIFFNLLVPYGEVLFSLGPLVVTKGALMGGIRRAVTLEGLLMLSRSCVRRDLALPGAFGKIVGESFRVFSILTEERQFFTRRNWFSRLDGLLVSLEESPAENEVVAEKNPATSGGRLVLVIMVILAWLPFFLVYGNN